MNKIKLSVITAVFNGVSSLENTIKSLHSQNDRNFEYIVIDGGSTDGTLDIINKYRNSINYFISERDSGYADAWNKGLSRATGDVIGLLNCGDLYTPGTIYKTVSYFQDMPEILTYGITEYLDKNRKSIGFNNKKFNEKNICKNFGFVHTSCFVPKILYDKVGLFNTTYKIAADAEWLLRAYRMGVKFVQRDNVIQMQTGGLSEKRKLEALKEYKMALYDNGFPFWDIELRYLENIIKIFIARKMKLWPYIG